MTDLNEWRLSYGSTVLDFGTKATGYPLAEQVDISDYDSTEEEQDYPASDGRVFGYDRIRGFSLGFKVEVLPTYPVPAKPWVPTLDAVSSFRAKWRADALRNAPGSYATLANLDRARQVYGRPRKSAPAHPRLRKGSSQILFEFDTVHADFYSTTEQTQTLTPVPPPTSGIIFPITFPMDVVGTSASTQSVTNGGDVDTWPIVEFYGPGRAHSVAAYSGATLLWTLNATGLINSDQVLTVDTRPWARGASIGGAPASGRVRGSRLEKCKIPPGTVSMVYSVSDVSGTAHAIVRWRNGYASL